MVTKLDFLGGGQERQNFAICFAIYVKLFLSQFFSQKLSDYRLLHSFFPEASPKHVDLGDPERLKVPAKYPPNSLACSRSNPSLLALSTAHFIVARVKNANQC